MTLRLYDTMSRSVTPVVPIAPPRVTMYSCGPTVWNRAHVGNFRTFLTVDTLRRWLEASGYDVFHIMNLTDVDDRIIDEAGQSGTDIRTFTEPFIAAFHEDRDWLGLRAPHAEPRATDYVPAMIDLVTTLLDRGIAYRSDDGSVYFSIARFPAYGRLSHLDPEALQTNRGIADRTLADEYAKESARDFVLWKAVRPEDEAVAAAWDAPFGRGRPGWHLECSAMALDLIRERFDVQELDIHTGGVDLVFPHHEDEIAQSCAFTGREAFARHWVHGEFLNVRGAKMSKRFGNTTTVRDLREDGWEPATLRLLMAQVHYRQQLDLTHDALSAARAGSRRVGAFGLRIEQESVRTDEGPLTDVFKRLDSDVRDALNDDLDTPKAVAHLFDAVREGNRLLDAGADVDRHTKEVWTRLMELFTIQPPEETRRIGTAAAPDDSFDERPPAPGPERTAWAEYWARQRLTSKRIKDFATADRIRAFLQQEGFEVRDRKDGVIELVERSSAT